MMIKLKELYVEQYAKLVELKGKYLDQHPAVIAQQARVDAITRRSRSARRSWPPRTSKRGTRAS